MSMKNTVRDVCLIACAGLPAASVQAQGPVARQEVVRINDLDLSSPAGARAAIARFRAAAGRLCGPLGPSAALVWELDSPRCVQRSVRDAVANLASPIVTAVYERRAVRPTYELAMAPTYQPVQ